MESEQYLIAYLESVPDPRVEGRCHHKLIDILVLALCATLCGAESYVDMELFGKTKEDWLKKYLELPFGIPSHDTIRRVFTLIQVEHLERALFDWAREIHFEKRICIDGKSIRGTDRKKNKDKATTHPLHLVNVYSHTTGLALGQSIVNGRAAAEIPGVINCLDMLELRKGDLISLDAASCNAKVTDKIQEKKADYLIALKKNQKNDFMELQQFFSKLSETQTQIPKKFWDDAVMTESSHGRYEKRSCRVISAIQLSPTFQRWKNIQCVAQVNRQREEDDQRYWIQEINDEGKISYARNTKTIRVSEETTFYISSKAMSANEFLQQTRDHWTIENRLHWILDVAFREDHWRTKHSVAARGLAVIRKIAFNLIQKEPSKGSKRGKIKKAGWDNRFLEQILFNPTQF